MIKVKCPKCQSSNVRMFDYSALSFDEECMANGQYDDYLHSEFRCGDCHNDFIKELSVVDMRVPTGNIVEMMEIMFVWLDDLVDTLHFFDDSKDESVSKFLVANAIWQMTGKEEWKLKREKVCEELWSRRDEVENYLIPALGLDGYPKRYHRKLVQVLCVDEVENVRSMTDAIDYWRTKTPEYLCEVYEAHFGKPSLVTSSHGNAEIDVDGKILSALDSFTEEYPKIVRFNLPEYKQYWGKLDDSYDILNLGYWLVDGTYEEPADDWRKMMKRMRESHSRANKVCPTCGK